ncbi:MAG TPA: YggU family protein [Euryarchaeota archaeon]|nr:YggU family protein [Euryarchaeota archaeon]
MDDYYTVTSQGIILHVRVRPNAKKNEIKDLSGDGKFLIVHISEPPSKGKANRELEKFLRKVFSKEAVIVSGFQAREKYVLIRGASVDEIKNVVERVRKS